MRSTVFMFGNATDVGALVVYWQAVNMVDGPTELVAKPAGGTSDQSFVY